MLFRSTAFITYKFKEKQVVDEVSLKLGNWRTKSYPIEIIADNQVIFSGNTPTSLGYVHLKTKPTLTDNITVRLKNNSVESDGFAQITELAEENNLKKDDIKEKGDLRIIEIDILTYQNPK